MSRPSNLDCSSSSSSCSSAAKSSCAGKCSQSKRPPNKKFEDELAEGMSMNVEEEKEDL